MKVKELVEKLNLKVLSGSDGLDREIEGCYVSDLLSDVMGYFNTVNLISAGSTADATITWFDTAGTELDPKFADAANGDFTITNDDVKDKKVGAPRWY